MPGKMDQGYDPAELFLQSLLKDQAVWRSELASHIPSTVLTQASTLNLHVASRIRRDGEREGGMCNKKGQTLLCCSKHCYVARAFRPGLSQQSGEQVGAVTVRTTSFALTDQLPYCSRRERSETNRWRDAGRPRGDDDGCGGRE